MSTINAATLNHAKLKCLSRIAQLAVYSVHLDICIGGGLWLQLASCCSVFFICGEHHVLVNCNEGNLELQEVANLHLNSQRGGGEQSSALAEIIISSRDDTDGNTPGRDTSGLHFAFHSQRGDRDNEVGRCGSVAKCWDKRSAKLQTNHDQVREKMGGFFSESLSKFHQNPSMRMMAPNCQYLIFIHNLIVTCCLILVPVLTDVTSYVSWCQVQLAAIQLLQRHSVRPR